MQIKIKVHYSQCVLLCFVSWLFHLAFLSLPSKLQSWRAVKAMTKLFKLLRLSILFQVFLSKAALGSRSLYTPWKEVAFENTPVEKFKDFGVGKSAGATRLWAITDRSDRVRGAIYFEKEGSWIQASGDAQKVVVGPAGVFVLNGMKLYFRSGITPDMPEGDKFVYTYGLLTSIDSGLYCLYGVNSGNLVYSYANSAFTNLGKEQQTVLSTSVGKYALWLTTEDKIIYRTGISSGNKGGNTPASFMNDGKILVSSSDEGMVISLDRNGTLYYRDGVNYVDRVGSHWVEISAPKFILAVADLFAIWGLDNNGKIWKTELDYDSSYIGCYIDTSKHELQEYSITSNGMTVGSCRQICALKNCGYAGLQNGVWCFCGNSYGSYGKAPESDCLRECLGNFNERCGGGCRNSVYKSGRLQISEISADQHVSKNEYLELVCKPQSVLSPLYVAWTNDGILVQNKTENTNLVVSTSQLGTFTYQCSVTHSGLKDPVSKIVTVTVHDSIVACGRHLSVNDPSRSSGNCGALKTIKELASSQWYQFYGNGVSQVPTSCVEQNRCGGKASGWLKGEHPEREDGVVTRKLCFSYEGDCCFFNVTVNVRQCFGYYIYKFQEIPDYFPGRICTEQEPRGHGPSSKVKNTKIFTSNAKTKNKALAGHKIGAYLASNSGVCNLYCLLTPQCKSYNYNYARKECELNDDKAMKGFHNLVTREGFTYFHPIGTGMKVVHLN